MLRSQHDKANIVPIAGNGAIGSPDIADGRIIPVLIVDCSEHPKLYELILIHEQTPPGDVTVKWGRKRFDKKSVYLSIVFHRPIATEAIFRFGLSDQAGLVDGIIHSRGVYLQPLQSGTRVIDGMNQPKIIVEIPSSATFDGWKAMHHAQAVKSYRAQGAPKKIAKALADEHLLRLSELWKNRQKWRSPPSDDN